MSKNKHWADKIDFNVPRQHYETLLKKPTKEVKLLIRKEAKRQTEWSKLKALHGRRIAERNEWIKRTKRKKRTPFSDQKYLHERNEVINIFVQLNLLSPTLKTKICNKLAELNFRIQFPSEAVAGAGAQSNWTCAVCKGENIQGTVLFCPVCLTKKAAHSTTAQIRPDHFIGLVKTLDLLIFFLDSVKFEHPSANAVKNSPNKEYLTSEHRLRIRSCDWYILEEYSNYDVVPPRRHEIVARRKRKVIDVEPNGNLASGTVLINRAKSCVCSVPNVPEGNSEVCTICYQQVSRLVENGRRFNPKMPHVKPVSNLEKETEKNRRREEYKRALKLVPAARGASSNPMVETSPLRLATTRNPHWKYKRKNYGKSLVNKSGKKAQQEDTGSVRHTDEKLQDLFKFHRKTNEDETIDQEPKIHWWLRKRPPPPTTEVITATKDTLAILGGEHLVGNGDFFRNRIDFTRDIITIQKEKIKLRKMKRAKDTQRKHLELLKKTRRALR
jgi:hypothetical protein